MTCYFPSRYIILSLRKLKFYGGWGAGAVVCVTDMMAGAKINHLLIVESSAMKFQNPIIIH